jgi:hypothetical protein
MYPQASRRWIATPELAVPRYWVEIVEGGSPSHLADLRSLRERQLAVPHHYSSWPLNSTDGTWVWTRVVGTDDRLITGFAIHLTSSRALPGTRIGEVDRLGRPLHEEIAAVMGDVLSETARRIPRLLRLDARIFDEEPVRRALMARSLAMAGWSPLSRGRHYSHTLVVPLAASDQETLHRFSKGVRSAMRKALGSPLLRFGPVTGTQYEGRIGYLHALPFERTGGMPPPIDIKGILCDSAGGDSLLVGAFASEGRVPEDLAALAWARFHGDHATLEINASQRSHLFSNALSPGFGLMSELFLWARRRGAHWMDLGGLPGTKPALDDRMRGIIEFKMRFSADFREVAEEWRLEPSRLLAGAAATTRHVANLVRGAHAAARKC